MPTLALLLFAAGLAAQVAPAPAAPVAPVVPAETAATKAREAAHARATQVRARLSPVRFTILSAEVAARIEKLPFAEGARFKQGDALVVFDDAVPRAQLGKARAAHESATRVLQSYRRLAELGSVSQLDLAVSESRVLEAKADLDLAEATFGKCVVRAPFAGRVGDMRIREHQFMQAGQPMLEIIDDSALELEFIAPSASLAWLRPGLALKVRIDETARTYEAKVIRIGAKVDPVSQTIKLAASVAGEHPELLSGMSGTVELPTVPAR
jgi:membrane fusion protein (multidrug efflux system)